MTRNGQRLANVTTTRLEVRWSRCAWKPRIVRDPIARCRPPAGDATESMTLYRRSGGRASNGGETRKSTPVVDWVAVRYENPPSRITF